ncbi:hypothetical protein KsCSTR_38800 [Candidatus Kuenenia stuttgartiensis]|uniref:Uncharacterized protein n=1 Tax=Kuenenia stuttgartiensis TaxID=174633 RepID=Q1PUQ1_KUEST|nr:hypothetical protein KsCSTR_38800 [Candidatus Kuenenia stuttgartiensis]CAJ70962.1 unknown protein [Candidatus Kuenenia stuttgartiensis]
MMVNYIVNFFCNFRFKVLAATLGTYPTREYLQKRKNSSRDIHYAQSSYLKIQHHIPDIA